MPRSKTLRFLAKAQTDRKISARVLAAVERGGKVTAEEVLEIAREFGFKISRAEFERDALRDIQRRYAAGEEDLGVALAAKKPKPKPKPPLSSCAKGCLSWTVNWHPTKL